MKAGELQRFLRDKTADDADVEVWTAGRGWHAVNKSEIRAVSRPLPSSKKNRKAA